VLDVGKDRRLRAVGVHGMGGGCQQREICGGASHAIMQIPQQVQALADCPLRDDFLFDLGHSGLGKELGVVGGADFEKLPLVEQHESAEGP